MPDVQGDPRLVECPACFAPPGKPCNAPTDTGRRDVSWYHLSREGIARPPVSVGDWLATPEGEAAVKRVNAMTEEQLRTRRLPEHLQIETLQDFLEQKGER